MNVHQVRATYKVESQTLPGKSYTVTLDPLHCDCPHFGTRLQKTKADCKHITAVRAFINKRREERQKKILNAVEHAGSIPYEELAESFDEHEAIYLLEKGAIVIKDGIVTKIAPSDPSAH